jgi:hypothetical protein
LANNGNVAMKTGKKNINFIDVGKVPEAPEAPEVPV